MTDEQVQDIIDNSIQAHWPNWEFRGQELAVWIKELRKYDYETTKQAVNDLYLSWTKDRYPKIGHILAQIRLTVNRKYETGRIAALFGIFTKEGRRRFFNFWGLTSKPEQEIKEFAEKIQRYANDVIGPGHYIYYYDTEEKDDTGYYGDEGFSVSARRKQARDKAFEDILDGPNTKTRRWLENLMADKERKRLLSGESVRIGEIMADELPF